MSVFAIPPPWNIEQKDVQIKQVIITRLLRRGEGKDESDPVRIVTQFWDMEGNMICEFDDYRQPDQGFQPPPKSNTRSGK